MPKGVSLAVCVLLSAAMCLAQFTLRGSISGLVTDPSDAVMPGVVVMLTDLDRNQIQRTEANSTGLYTFTQLNIGRYQVSVERPGFRKAVSDLTLASGQSARLDLKLHVGEVTESVEVAASAPLLQTGQAAVGQTVDRATITSLPTRGRDFTSFAALAPNISSYSDSGGVSYVVGGGGDNGMYINGVYSNGTWGGTTGTVYSPSIEALSEVKIETAGFSAANGRDISTFQATIRGGTNSFHGSGWDTFHHSALRAWNPYEKLTLEPGTKKPLVQHNEFGGNLGGPVAIPKLFNGRDRAFFFVNLERLHENSAGESGIYRVPTEAERQGDFSGLLERFPDDPNYVLWNPFSTVIDEEGNSTRTPIPNNDLRTIGVVPEAREILNMFPLPNGYSNPSNPEDLSNYSTFQRGGARQYRLDTRFDYRITDNDNVYINYSRQQSDFKDTGQLFPELRGSEQVGSQLVTANYAHVFTPNLTNESIFGYAHLVAHPPSANPSVTDYMHQTDTLRNKYFKNIGTGNDQGFHAITFDGGDWPSIGYNEIFENTQTIFQFSNNTSYIRGAHSLKFGFNFLSSNERDWDYLRDVQFRSDMTRGGSSDGLRGGDGIASFLLGVPSYILQPFKFPQGEEARMDFTTKYWGFYVEDKWQITPKLTVSLGLRNDLSIPMYSPIKYGNVKMDFSYPGWQELIPGRYEGLPQRFVPAPKSNFAPRASIAYQLKNDLVVRASYGIFYMAGSTVNGGATVDYMMGAVPGYIGAEYFNAAAGVHDDLPYLRFSDIFPTQRESTLGTFPISTGPGAGYFDYPKAVVAYDEQSGAIPYYQRYLFELQKGFGADTLISLSFLGGRGTKLLYYENVNKPAYRSGWPSDNVYNEARPSPRFDDVRLIRAGKNSFYNSVAARFDRRMSNGLHVSSHYTFSKAVQDYGIPQAGGFGVPEDGFGGYASIVSSWDWNGHLGRGEAPFSHPHRFVTSFAYDVPWGKGLPAVPKAILSGWTASGILTFESGQALTVWNGVTSARDHEPDLPNVSSNPNLARGERTFEHYFQTEAFSAPPQDVKGNAGPGIVRGPGANNWDIGISKTFRSMERLSVQLRCEMLNAFNHTQWSEIDTTFDDSAGSTFGRVTGARDGRNIQFFLKVSF